MSENRIAAAIERHRARIAAGVKVDGSSITADLVVAEKFLDNTALEHFTFQNVQARAHATGKITTDEARTIYVALGEGPSDNGWAKGTDYATKVVVTQIMGELMARR